MMRLSIDPQWTFNEAVDNLKALKTQYKEFLASFLDDDVHNRYLFRKQAKQDVYALNFQEYKRDKIWEYLNDYEFLYVIVLIRNRQK